jgi:23S rRNA (guanine2445-N2)-methyltransferase / 23S rRNA (guanine2069-N7)-methyltransferase
LSRTYLDWARRNLDRNGFSDPRRHSLVQADVLAWLEQPPVERYDLIFLDPPTVSRSKRMTGRLDLQRDHVQLIRQTLMRLAPGGLLIFSNNFRRFRLDAAALTDLEVRDVTAATIAKDFERNPRIHQCFEIRVPRGAKRAPRQVLTLRQKPAADEQRTLE